MTLPIEYDQFLVAHHPVESLFGGLSFMIDPSSNKMKDNLIYAEMTIRMSTVFKNNHYFGCIMLQKMEKSYEYLCTNSIPDIMDFFLNG